jgi:hypothetical protein
VGERGIHLPNRTGERVSRCCGADPANAAH